jgi:hypothetical protein
MPGLAPLRGPASLLHILPVIQAVVTSFLCWNTRWGRVFSTSCESSNISLAILKEAFILKMVLVDGPMQK